MFCASCGAQVADGVRFCPNCGATMGALAPSPTSGAAGPSPATGGVMAPPPPPPPAVPRAGRSPGGIPPQFLVVGAAVVAVAAVLLYLFVLKGGGESTAKNTLDPQKADQLAHASLFSPKDLPGSGWTVSKVDEFNDDNEPLSSDASCKTFSDALNQVKAKTQPKRVGRAEAGYSKSVKGVDFDTVDVEVEVNVYSDGKDLAQALSIYKNVLDNDTFRKCLESALADQYSSGSQKVTAKVVTPATTAPSGGVAKAYDVSLPSTKETIHFEVYLWQYGNAAITVTASGPKDSVTSDIVTAAVNKTVSGLQQAASANPPTPLALGVATSTPSRTTPTSTPRTGTAVPSRTATPGGGTSAGKLGDLPSYRYSFKMDGNGGPLKDLADQFASFSGATPTATSNISFEVAGSYIKPDKGDATIKIGTFTVRVVTIGRQQWTSFGGFTGDPDSASRSASDYSLAAAVWDDSGPSLLSSLTCSNTRETVNGVSTRKCGIDQSTLDLATSLLGGITGGISDVKSLSKFTVDLWVADSGGYPARLRITMAGKDTSNKDFQLNLSMDITDVNSSSIKIDPLK